MRADTSHEEPNRGIAGGDCEEGLSADNLFLAFHKQLLDLMQKRKGGKTFHLEHGIYIDTKEHIINRDKDV